MSYKYNDAFDISFVVHICSILVNLFFNISNTELVMVYFISSASGTAVKDTKRRKGKGSKQVTIKEDNEFSAEEEAKLPKDKALFGKDAEITNESVLIKVQEILAVRGKKVRTRTISL